jgi:hypothetical protein
VYLIRWKLAFSLGVMKSPDLLRDHRLDAYIRMVGIGCMYPATEPAIETLQATGCAKVLAFPGWEFLLQRIVGDGQPKVAPQCGNCLRLAVSIGADDFEVAAQHGFEALSFPDFTVFLEDFLRRRRACFSERSLGGRIAL